MLRQRDNKRERDAFCTEFCALWFSATTATRLCRGTFPALAIVVGNGKFRKKDLLFQLLNHLYPALYFMLYTDNLPIMRKRINCAKVYSISLHRRIKYSTYVKFSYTKYRK